ncbi:FAD binding domain-containing protein [Celeribacter baekdonensis]|uniref:FAD-binding molybdopterin dehydrogenase n=1 Tax=Celeribacter baekdonensis TaxID=875171 RepID=A0A2R4M7I1_9RHOB|nr:FAD binding domain-containing protein [Celeribacter baekdonensis]AVW93086.1 FAD-binding molybdopterin dehydrogenase [Celeribacter baekdonensis]
MMEIPQQSLISVTRVSQALDILTHLGDTATLMAGGTWVMREARERTFVSLADIPELTDISLDDQALSVGAMATHQDLCDAITGAPDLAALATAAGKSATPAIRRMATLGGNLCTRAFHSADLAPALLALNAEVTLETLSGPKNLSLEDYLNSLDIPPHILHHVTVPRVAGRSAHVRLMQRQAGEYPLAVVSLSAAIDPNGALRDLRIAVGSVEKRARRWHALEALCEGQKMTSDSIRAHATLRASQDFVGRDAVDSQGWYRLRVLPALVAQAFSDVSRTEQGAEPWC